MAVQPHVRNPMEWGWDRLKETGQAIGSAASTMDGAWEAREAGRPPAPRGSVRRVLDAPLRR